MENEPLISVIVPVYNVEKFLEKCVNSIINQTYRNLEIILVDDGSTDSSGKMCDELKERDPRIRVIHKENGGQASARNLGLDEASGEFISFIDSDDYVGNQFLETLFSSIKTYDSDIAICGYTVCDENGNDSKIFHMDSEKRITVKEFWDDVILGREILYGAVEPPLKLYKSELFNNLRFREIRIIEDEEILYDLIKKCRYISISTYCNYYYVQHEDSTMHRQYSVDRLAASVVFIERSRKFFSDGFQEYAECTLMTAAVMILEGMKKIQNRTPGKNSTLADLMKEFRRMSGILRKNSRSWKFRIKSFIFSVSPILYKVIL